jgi:hypothetical protein
MREQCPGDRVAMEQLFDPLELNTLDAHCAACGVVRSRWHLSRVVAPPWQTLAVARRAAQLEHEQDCSPTLAIQCAAVELGLSPDTIRQRRKTANRARRSRGGKSTPREIDEPWLSSAS